MSHNQRTFHKIVLALLLFIINITHGQYTVPEALVEPLHPKGFRVSIPDSEGVKLFAFHGRINEEIGHPEAGNISVDVNKAKNGRWTYTDRTIQLKLGDTINYWTYVLFNNGGVDLGFPNDDQSFTVTELPTQISTISTTARTVSTMTTPNCLHSVTEVHNANQKLCVGQVIFEETFERLNPNTWRAENKFASDPDFEFVWYTSDEQNVRVQDGILRIQPTLTNNKYGPGFVNSNNLVDLGANCTGKPNTYECRIQSLGAAILPPVLSAQINTRASFAFKYGVVEIRAKLPHGDWIYPQLFLNPKDAIYGDYYKSGQMRVAFTFGNDDLNDDLFAGCVLGSTKDGREFAMRKKKLLTESGWSDNYHTFALKWQPVSLSLLVDGEEFGMVYPTAGGFASQVDKFLANATVDWSKGTSLAPFDEMMYLAVGVGVGGHSFPDDITGKPWMNFNPKSLIKFYRALNNWSATWNEHSLLEIDYIRVYAV